MGWQTTTTESNVAFNLKKYSEAVPSTDASPAVQRGFSTLEDMYDPDENVDIQTEDVVDTARDADQQAILQQAQNLPLIDEIQRLLALPEYKPYAQVISQQPEIRALLEADDLTVLRQTIDDEQLGPTVEQFQKATDRVVQPEELKTHFDRLKSLIDANQDQKQVQRDQAQMAMPMASRTAQSEVIAPDPVDEVEKGKFIEQYLYSLVAYQGDRGEGDTISEKAKQEILGAVSRALQNDANDALEAIQVLGHNEQDKARQFLGIVYENFVAPAALGTSTVEQPVMSEHNPKGIIKFNLSDHVLNNKQAMIKTAADQFGQQYMLYGPSEKRICPKLRGKGGGLPGTGDVVSEYICRHHCLDGIVIDDNKTVCGEALWRANAMDKFSREYVNPDGDIVGGYINKRFEINRNVPEENKMRLKPGETRKPRPAEIFGNMEARMQAMREKEGEKRGYSPTTDTSPPFEWCHDQDQNNVEQTQKERNRREEASGHELAPGQGAENNPKKSFNMKDFKTAKTEKCPCGCGKNKGECGCHEDLDKGKSYSAYVNDKNRKENWTDKKASVENDKVVKVQIKDFNRDPIKQKCKSCGEVTKSFNLKQHKKAQGAGIPVSEDGTPIEPHEQKVRDDDRQRILRRMRGEKGETDRERIQRRLKGKNAQSEFDNALNDLDRKIEDIEQMPSDNIVDLIHASGATREEFITQTPFFPPEEQNAIVTALAQDRRVNADLRSNLSRWQQLTVREQQTLLAQAYDSLFVGKEAKSEKGVTYKGEHFKYNPWAVCNKSTGGKNEAGDAKFERCCLPGTTVTMDDGSFKPIEKVEVGDLVITHKGHPRKVMRCLEHHVEEESIGIKVSGLPYKLWVTSEHPIYSLKKLKDGKSGIPTEYAEKSEFIPARELRIGDCVHTPTLNLEMTDENIDERTAFVLGIYASEGHCEGTESLVSEWQCGHNGATTKYANRTEKGFRAVFSLNAKKDKMLVDELYDFGQNVLGCPVKSRQGTSSSLVEIVTIYSRSFAELCCKHVGKGARTKKLSKSLMSAAPSIQKAFLAGYIRGDGCVYNHEGLNKISMASASQQLVQQLLLLTDRCGITSTMQFRQVTGGPLDRNKCFDQWSLHINASNSYKLSSYFPEKKFVNIYKRGRRFAMAACTYGRILEVTKQIYSGKVYNLEVAGDESYVANLCSVHNCVQHVKDQDRDRKKDKKDKKKDKKSFNMQDFKTASKKKN